MIVVNTADLSAPALCLASLHPLTPAELGILCTLHRAGTVMPGGSIAADGQPLPARFVLSGWAARVRWLEDGRRQLVSLLIPGDGIGLTEGPQPLTVCPIVAITRVDLADAGPVRAGQDDYEATPGLCQAVRVAVALGEAHLINQIVRLGRQTAYERLAHLFLELRDRLAAVGLADRDSYAMPLTQEMLGDLTGLTPVHVNRTLQQLRRDGMLDLGGGRLRLLKPRLLVALADYRFPEPSRFVSGRGMGASANASSRSAVQ